MAARDEGMAQEQLREELTPGQVQDDLLLQVLAALEAQGAHVRAVEAYGVGKSAAVVLDAGGRRVRLSAQPW